MSVRVSDEISVEISVIAVSVPLVAPSRRMLVNIANAVQPVDEHKLHLFYKKPVQMRLSCVVRGQRKADSRIKHLKRAVFAWPGRLSVTR
jgi:hypothetical protein